jgi:hypothetical protein
LSPAFGSCRYHACAFIGTRSARTNQRGASFKQRLDGPHAYGLIKICTRNIASVREMVTSPPNMCESRLWMVFIDVTIVNKFLDVCD